MSNSDWLNSGSFLPATASVDTSLRNFLVRLMRKENLTQAEAYNFFGALTDENANPAQIAGALVAMSAKGETFEELAGMAKAMRNSAVKITGRTKNLVDTAGTGSGAIKTFNVSTAASFVAAGAGLQIAKHGNRAVTSNTGSADVLSELGVNIAGEPELVQACLNGAGICFIFAPRFHPILKRVGDVRRNLGVRTSLNLLGPLSNPAKAPRQLMGVWHPSLIEPMAKALSLLGTDKSWIVHGSDGLDEISLAKETFVAEIVKDKVETFKIEPEDFGVARGSMEKLYAKSPQESANIIKEILSGKRRDEARSLVVINAAATLVIGGIAKTPMQAARLAEQSIDSGQAQSKLERLIMATNKK